MAPRSLGLHIQRPPRWVLYWLAVLVMGAAPVQLPAGSAQPLHPVGETPAAADFTLIDIDGQSHTLTDYRGRVVILNFWATWCPPCRYELPSMERAYRVLKQEDIAMLAVNVGEDEDTIFTFTSDYPVTFPLLMDRDSRVIQAYPVIGLPTTFVIDPQGRLAYRAIGTREWDDPGVLEQIRVLKASEAKLMQR